MASPKLRFKEFGSEWNSIAIGTFLKIKSGLGFKAEEYTTAEEIRLLQIENVGYGAVKWTHNVKYVPSDYLKLHEGLVLKDGDLVLALNRPVTNDQLKIAKLTKQDSPSILYQRVGKLEFIKEEFDSNFIFQIFQKDVKNYVLNSSLGSDQPFISTTDLYKYKLCLPSKEEQTKIASFLSTVDEKIAQLTQKHELLSQYKQGMMQKLFSQQIRFKADDGSEFGEWENSYIGNQCKITTGNKDTQNKVDDGLFPFFVRSQTVEKINSYSMDCEAILTSGDGVGVGKNYHYINGKFDFHQRVYCLYDFSENIIGKYLYIYFSNHFYDRVKRLSAKNSVDSVRMDMISKMEIKLPCLEEQTKIANFLSAIDQKIEKVAQQIEETKQWKKGLLQQMFV
ncbi:restriction endonuclease subunit S [Acinetobacter junii]|uniref:restriction endonuclease subunit S n=1 Tax=Acinetobacter junii TaxID=40215 RepID=UPI00190186A2|nr:restriction endonuclease subunit S [Acinetobacter junii]MBJ8439763.1 restriction endonuclease subunit S [Acinetobacter junii]